jgi:superfamily II DNA helicase RecQ
MSIWTQQAGRGGRDPQICARAILLVQPSVFQEIKPGKGVEPEEGEVKYRKDVEEGLHEWIETGGCRCDTFAVYFNDGVPQKGMF